MSMPAHDPSTEDQHAAQSAEMSQVASDAMGRALDRAASEPLRLDMFVGVVESLRRDYPGWDAYNARLAAVPDPDSPEGKAERHRISFEYTTSPEWREAQRRLYGQPEPDAEDEGDPLPSPRLRCGFGEGWVEGSGPIYDASPGFYDPGCAFTAKSRRKLLRHHRRVHQRDEVPRPAVVAIPEPSPTTWDRVMDYVFETGPGWIVPAIIVGVVLVWAVILDSLFGLENLRRLLGWTT